MTTTKEGIVRGRCIAAASGWGIQQSTPERVLFLVVCLPMIANTKLVA